MKTLDITVTSIHEVNEKMKFLLAGRAKFTLKNEKTLNRYTFSVKLSHDVPGLYFVSLLIGNNNEFDYTYIGVLRKNGDKLNFYLTKKSKLTNDSVPVKVFNWLLKHIDNFPEEIKFYHEGCCARCGRTLTVPESIISGFGPECIKMIGDKLYE